jgi:hypothetical protein
MAMRRQHTPIVKASMSLMLRCKKICRKMLPKI